MGYDIFIRDPATGKAVEVMERLTGDGAHAANDDPGKGMLAETFKADAHVNITYRYGRYYYETYEKEGIRAIYGKSCFDSIAMLEKMIANLQEKYQKDGEWVITKRCKILYFDENGRETAPIASAANGGRPIRYEEVEIEVCEGDTDDCWQETAANAIKPLYQLLAMAKMRPDCIWDGD